MTQMVGRIMRQPYARRIETSTALNQSYIYCYNVTSTSGLLKTGREKSTTLNQGYIYCYSKDVGKAVEGVKAGLENEGLTGLGDNICVHGRDILSAP